MIGVTFGKATNLLDLAGGTETRHRNFGATVSRFGEGLLGFEGAVVFTPSFFQGDDPRQDLVETSRAVSLMGNVVLTTPRLWTEYSLRPFVSGGVGLLHVLAEDDPVSVFTVDANLWGFNVGAGAIGFLSDRTGVRFEMRYFGTLARKDLGPLLTIDGPAHLRYLTASIGLVIRR